MVHSKRQYSYRTQIKAAHEPKYLIIDVDTRREILYDQKKVLRETIVPAFYVHIYTLYIYYIYIIYTVYTRASYGCSRTFLYRYFGHIPQTKLT